MTKCMNASWMRMEQCGWRLFFSIPLAFVLLFFVFYDDRSLLDSALSLLDDQLAPLYGVNSTFQTTAAIATTTTATAIATGSALPFAAFSSTADASPAETPASRPPMSPECNIFDGEWVYDETYPLYKNCSLAELNFRCSARPDNEYQKWRWQPKQCNIPRFNAEDILTRLKGKRVVFVGDSMGRTQWESFNCLLSEGVKNKSSVRIFPSGPIDKRAPHLRTRFEEHNITVDYHRSPFLVRGGTDVPNGSPSKVRCSVKLNEMNKKVAKKLVNSDILVINTGHWWAQQKTYDRGCHFQVDKELVPGMSILEGYEKAVGTITSWINDHIDFSRTDVIFRSYEPAHYELSSATVPYRSISQRKDYVQTEILQKAVGRMENPATVLNITSLSAYRPDGHLYNWTTREGPGDHTHWCLPGVPDTWNEVLYASLLLRGRGPFGAGQTK